MIERQAPRARALVISPFATFPGDAGQRRRAQQTTALFRDMGYEITYLLYAFEGSWYWRWQRDAMTAMRAEWGDVRLFYSNRQVGLPPANGLFHGLDEWWDPLFGEYLNRLLEYEPFDLVVVHNVWLSRALDHVPRRVVKVLDSHDIFYPRRELFAKLGLNAEFFLPQRDEELAGLSRAGIVLTIKHEESELLRADGVSASIVNIPYVPADRPVSSARTRSYTHPAKVRFGFLGTSHGFNIAGLNALIREIDEIVRQTHAPIELVVGGTVCGAIDLAGRAFRPTLLGRVPSEAEFYQDVDFAVVPVFDGTGFKVKVAELAALAQPLLCAAHAAEGMALDHACIMSGARQMAARMAELAFHRPALAAWVQMAQAADRRLIAAYREGGRQLTSAIDARARSMVSLIPGTQFDAQLLMQLLAALSYARSTRDFQRWVICVEPAVGLDLEALNEVAQPGLIFLHRESPAAQEAMRSPGACIVADPCDLIQGQLAFRLSPAVGLLCDLRFFDTAAMQGVDPRDLPQADGFLVTHRQHHNLRSHREFFCAPLMIEEMRWDPCAAVLRKSLAGATGANAMRVRTPHLALCQNTEHAGLVTRLLPPRARPDVTVLPIDHRDAAATALTWLLEQTSRRDGAKSRFIDCLPVQCWLGAVADEVEALVPGLLARTGLPSFIADQIDANRSIHPEERIPAPRSIFWEIGGRVQRAKTRRMAA